MSRQKLYVVFSAPSLYRFMFGQPGRLHDVGFDVSNIAVPLAKCTNRIEYGITQRQSPLVGIERVRATPLSIERSVQDLVDMYRVRLAGPQ